MPFKDNRNKVKKKQIDTKFGEQQHIHPEQTLIPELDWANNHPILSVMRNIPRYWKK